MEISWVCARGNMSGLDAGPEAEGDCLLPGPLPRVWVSEVLRTPAFLAQAPTTPLSRVRVPKPCSRRFAAGHLRSPLHPLFAGPTANAPEMTIQDGIGSRLSPGGAHLFRQTVGCLPSRPSDLGTSLGRTVLRTRALCPEGKMGAVHSSQGEAEA